MELSPIDSMDWLGRVDLRGEQQVRLLLLDEDLRACQISFVDYHSTVLGPDASDLDRAKRICYAKAFVCAMRRVGRVLEAIVANRAQLDSRVGDVVRQAWRKHRKMFETYRQARDVVEHVDSEVPGKTRRVLMNLCNDTLQATPENAAPVSRESLDAAVRARTELVEALSTHMLMGERSGEAS